MTASSGPARPTDPAEALAVLRELVELWNTPIGRGLTGPYRKRYETAQARARALVAGAAAPAGDGEPVETREEWGVAYGEEVDPGWRYVDRKTADVWMDYARDSPHMNARLFRRTVSTSPWVVVPDPADTTNTEG